MKSMILYGFSLNGVFVELSVRDQ